jgi:alkylation response protein AidB-like acyl-CoA dehydrogenase
MNSTESSGYPWENVRRLVDNNLAGLFIPEAYGGAGASLTSTVAVVERVGLGCSSTAAILCAYQLGAFPVLLAGREDQKQLYLGEMTKGVATSFALSEREAGSMPRPSRRLPYARVTDGGSGARSTGSATAARHVTTWFSPRPIRLLVAGGYRLHGRQSAGGCSH